MADSPDAADTGEGERNTGSIPLPSSGDPRPQQKERGNAGSAQTSLSAATPRNHVNKQSTAAKLRLTPVRKHSLLTFNKKKGEIQISKAARSKLFRSHLHSTGMIDRTNNPSSRGGSLTPSSGQFQEDIRSQDSLNPLAEVQLGTASNTPTATHILASLTSDDAAGLEAFGDFDDSAPKQPLNQRLLPNRNNLSESWKISTKLKDSLQDPIGLQPEATSAIKQMPEAVLQMRFAGSDGFSFIIAQSQAGTKPDNYWQDELHLEHILTRHDKQITLEFPHDLELMHETPGGPFGRLDLLGNMTWKLSQFWAGLQTSLEQLPQVETPPEAFTRLTTTYRGLRCWWRV